MDETVEKFNRMVLRPEFPGNPHGRIARKSP